MLFSAAPLFATHQLCPGTVVVAGGATAGVVTGIVAGGVLAVGVVTGLVTGAAGVVVVGGNVTGVVVAGVGVTVTGVAEGMVTIAGVVEGKLSESCRVQRSLCPSAFKSLLLNIIKNKKKRYIN